MCLMTVCQKPDTGKPAQGRRSCPWLPDGLQIDRPSQVLPADITCLPMRKGFLCLAATMDRFTRKVLARRISQALGARFCLKALNGPSTASARLNS